MAVTIKTKREIDLMRESCARLETVFDELEKMIRPGISTLDIDREGERLIRSMGGIPNFLNYNGYPASICTSVNEEVVHGIPSRKRILKEGDIISLDAGMILDGYHSDAARTYPVGKISEEAQQLIRVTRESFFEGIKMARPGNHLHDISNAIDAYVSQFGYGIVRELTGHGIGHEMHEDPQVPNYGRRGNGPSLKASMCIAIEPMITMGKRDIWLDNKDRWTVRTQDGKPAAHFEHTVVVRKGKAEILSSFEEVERIEGKLY